MLNRVIMSLFASGLILSAGSMAHAQTLKKITDFTVRAETTTNLASGQKSLTWDARQGRWGMTFNVAEPTERQTQLNDLQAGAYFKVTPSLRIGGAVALGDQRFVPSYKRTEPQSSSPRVRLETAFKF